MQTQDINQKALGYSTPFSPLLTRQPICSQLQTRAPEKESKLVTPVPPLVI